MAATGRTAYPLFWDPSPRLRSNWDRMGGPIAQAAQQLGYDGVWTRSRWGGRLTPSPWTHSRWGGRLTPSPGTRSRWGGRLTPSPWTHSRWGGRLTPSSGSHSRWGGRLTPSPGTHPPGCEATGIGWGWTHSRWGGRLTPSPGTHRPGCAATGIRWGVAAARARIGLPPLLGPIAQAAQQLGYDGVSPFAVGRTAYPLFFLPPHTRG